jgi:hypothetical protein
MAKKHDAVKIAEIQARQALTHDALGVLCDPLWSSILGFIAVHEARKANLVGPVADDILYGGIIAINTTRAGLTREVREGAVGMAGAAGQMVSGAKALASEAIGMIAGAVK